MFWGIDLGGTKIEGIVLPPSGDEPVCRIRIDTEQEGGYEHILSRIAVLVESIGKETKLPFPDRIGLGMPGTIEPSTGLAKNANTTCLIGRPLATDLSRLLGMEVRAQNDANCFALAEATLGAARGYEVVFGVIMGTGVGGAIVAGGKVLPGHHGIAGEWGHNVLIPDGEPCYCGLQGCVETVISGKGLEGWHAARTGKRITLRQIVQASEQGDRDAAATIERLVDYFGRAIAAVVNVLDPDAIVLGGGVGNVEALYRRGKQSLEKWMFNPRYDGALLRPQLGDSAGVFGAAMLCR